MTAIFKAHLQVLAAQPRAAVAVAAFALQEGYNTGWGGTATVVGAWDSGMMTAGNMFGALMASGIRAGRPVSLRLALHGGSVDGAVVRQWPCVVGGLQPYQLSGSAAACYVHLLDPVSFLAEQPIWGAYRSVSAGEIVGGALSLAAGGDGKPTLSPLLPGLPALRIAEGYRNKLKTVPHAIAAGQTLGDWLAEFLALLSLRAELSVSGDEQALVLELLDSAPRRQPLEMTVVPHTEVVDGAETATSGGSGAGDSNDDPYDDPYNDPYDDPYADPYADSYADPHGSGSLDPPLDDGRILITGHSGFPGVPRRGGIIDDPTMGSPRVVYALGAIGTVLTGPGLDTEEADHRIHGSLLGTYAEMVVVSAVSGQPRIRMGDVVTPSPPVHGVANWQVAGVTHSLRGSVYNNDLTLLRGDITWCPELPLCHPPVYVTGLVDGGQDFAIHEPVPRDQLGRIKVSFPFTPTSVGREAAELWAADTTGDGRVRLDDFSENRIESFTDDREQWEEKAAQYEAGEFADPYPGRADDDLSADEQESRDALRDSREKALAYMAYKKTVGDRDHDGVISDRDELISDELSEALKTAAGREELRSLWRMRAEERDQYLSEQEKDVDEMEKLLQEYVELFGAERDDLSEEVLDARTDAEDVADRWPPRIPLPLVTPMAGAMHGFISAHRHADMCRIAVHNPLSAEIVGFQYRDDRRINVDIAGAVAGFVVEHDYSQAWSGVIFRRSEYADQVDETEIETETETEIAPPPLTNPNPDRRE